jgi:SPX domain protein involved in polyphosphate accumulation
MIVYQVRISLDTELTMVREDNWDGRRRSGDNWRRTDIGIDAPFEQLPAEDKECFKYVEYECRMPFLKFNQIRGVGGETTNTDGTGASCLGD